MGKEYTPWSALGVGFTLKAHPLSGGYAFLRVNQMYRATSPMLNLAKRVMAYETLANKSSEAKNPAAFPAGERLNPQLATLMGNNGFRALLLRSLALAKAEVPWLRGVQVNADGTWEGFETNHADLDAAEFDHGKMVLLAQLLGLLVAFIGPKLTQRLVGETWPKILLNDEDFDHGRKNEKIQ